MGEGASGWLWLVVDVFGVLIGLLAWPDAGQPANQ
jgi:hypothetical protein